MGIRVQKLPRNMSPAELADEVVFGWHPATTIAFTYARNLKKSE
jgi:hypothetical protein